MASLYLSFQLFIPTAFIFPFPNSDAWKQESDQSGGFLVVDRFVGFGVGLIFGLGVVFVYFHLGIHSAPQVTNQLMNCASLGLVSSSGPSWLYKGILFFMDGGRAISLRRGCEESHPRDRHARSILRFACWNSPFSYTSAWA